MCVAIFDAAVFLAIRSSELGVTTGDRRGQRLPDPANRQVFTPAALWRFTRHCWRSRQPARPGSALRRSPRRRLLGPVGAGVRRRAPPRCRRRSTLHRPPVPPSMPPLTLRWPWSRGARREPTARTYASLRAMKRASRACSMNECETTLQGLRASRYCKVA